MHTKQQFFYTINYPELEEDLCRLELRVLFGIEPAKKYFFSPIDFDASRSPFIKEKIKVERVGEDFEGLLKHLSQNPFPMDQFKVIFVRPEESSFGYRARLNAMGRVGHLVQGYANLKEPKALVGITELEGKWIFGTYERNDCIWHKHNDKPNTYSHSLHFRVSRALVNLAVGHDLQQKLIDPCCGVGTVLLEALSMGIDAKGVEINPLVARNARQNLLYFGYPDIITLGNMHEIEEKFDVAIVDIPYGLLTPITKEEQQVMISTARRIARKLVLVTFENMDKEIVQANFQIMERGTVTKGSFVRYIHICV